MTSPAPEGWQVSPLGSMASVNWGNTSLTKDSYTENGFPAYSASGNDGLVPVAEHSSAGVVLSAIGARCGRTFLTSQKWTAIKNTITILSDNHDINFLYQVFNFNEPWNKSGGAQPFISLADARNAQILHPPPLEQKKIASILTSVDEVIENTQKQIDKLQDLKKATMNELLTKGIGHTEFKDSELGRIPKDWNVATLESVSSFRRGSFPQPYGNPEWYDDRGFPFVQVFDIASNRKLKHSTKARISQKAADMSVFIPAGSLLVSLQGSIGRVAITQYDAYVDRTVLIFSNYESSLDRVFFSLIIEELFRKQKEVADGGIIKTITKETLRSFQITVPPIAEQKKIADVLQSLETAISNCERKSSQVVALKTGLMQDLLTGKVRVTVD